MSQHDTGWAALVAALRDGDLTVRTFENTGVVNVGVTGRDLARADVERVRAALGAAGFEEVESWIATEGASWLSDGIQTVSFKVRAKPLPTDHRLAIPGTPEGIADELRRRQIPVFRQGDSLGGTTDSAREVMHSARLGGWERGTPGPKPRHINRGRLLAAIAREVAECRRNGCTHGQPALDIRPAGAS